MRKKARAMKGACTLANSATRKSVNRASRIIKNSRAAKEQRMVMGRITQINSHRMIEWRRKKFTKAACVQLSSPGESAPFNPPVHARARAPARLTFNKGKVCWDVPRIHLIKRAAHPFTRSSTALAVINSCERAKI